MPLTPAVAASAADQIVTALKVPADGKKAALENWVKIVGIILTSIQDNAMVMPTALIAPPGVAGGPVTGTGTVK